MRVTILVEGLKAAVIHDLIDVIVEFVLRHEVVLTHGLTDDLADRHTRGKRGERVLEDDLHLRAQGAHLLRGEVVDLLTVEEDLTGGLRVVQAEDGAARGGLTAAGLTDETHRRAALQVEGDTVDSLDIADRVGDHTALDREVFLQVIDLKNVLRVIFHGGEIGVLERIVLMLSHLYSPSFPFSLPSASSSSTISSSSGRLPS